MTVIIECTEDQLDTEFAIGCIDIMLRRSVQPVMVGEGTYQYKITSPTAIEKYEHLFAMAIAQDIQVRGVTFWVEVLNSTTDNKVALGWPDRMMTDPNDPEKKVSKRVNQYTVVVKGTNGKSLVLCEHSLIEGGTRLEVTTEEVKRYLAKYSAADTAKLIYGKSHNAWLLANTDQVT